MNLRIFQLHNFIFSGNLKNYSERKQSKIHQQRQEGRPSETSEGQSIKAKWTNRRYIFLY